MGFDMHMVNTPQEAPAGYDAGDPNDLGYFRIGYSMMPALVNVMRFAGLIDDDQVPPEFPKWPPAELDPQRAKQLEPYLGNLEKLRAKMTPSEVVVLDKYAKAFEAVAATMPQHIGKVPVFKFVTNDNWWVSPEECRWIALGLQGGLRDSPQVLAHFFQSEECEEEDAIDMIDSWAAFNNLAADNQGYRVN